MFRLDGIIYIAATILFTVYGQLILKWRLNTINPNLDGDLVSKVKGLFYLLIDPYIASGLGVAVLASLTWMMALNKYDLSFAYPFMSLNFVFVVALSILMFGETLTVHKVVGVLLIVIGTFVATR